MVLLTTLCDSRRPNGIKLLILMQHNGSNTHCEHNQCVFQTPPSPRHESYHTVGPGEPITQHPEGLVIQSSTCPFHTPLTGTSTLKR